jgi:hypothetical protein
VAEFMLHDFCYGERVVALGLVEKSGPTTWNANVVDVDCR